MRCGIAGTKAVRDEGPNGAASRCTGMCVRRTRLSICESFYVLRYKNNRTKTGRTHPCAPCPQQVHLDLWCIQPRLREQSCARTHAGRSRTSRRALPQHESGAPPPPAPSFKSAARGRVGGGAGVRVCGTAPSVGVEQRRARLGRKVASSRGTRASFFHVAPLPAGRGSKRVMGRSCSGGAADPGIENEARTGL